MDTTSILPEGIIEFEILTRRPVKSLMRFKSVCKSWNSLISSRGFIKSVRNSNHDSLTLISMHDIDSNCHTVILLRNSAWKLSLPLRSLMSKVTDVTNLDLVWIQLQMIIESCVLRQNNNSHCQDMCIHAKVVAGLR